MSWEGASDDKFNNEVSSSTNEHELHDDAEVSIKEDESDNEVYDSAEKEDHCSGAESEGAALALRV